MSGGVACQRLDVYWGCKGSCCYKKIHGKIASELQECPYPHVYDFSVQEETAGL
jgi:hypothetical protein